MSTRLVNGAVSVLAIALALLFLVVEVHHVRSEWARLTDVSDGATAQAASLPDVPARATR